MVLNSKFGGTPFFGLLLLITFFTLCFLFLDHVLASGEWPAIRSQDLSSTACVRQPHRSDGAGPLSFSPLDSQSVWWLQDLGSADLRPMRVNFSEHCQLV